MKKYATMIIIIALICTIMPVMAAEPAPAGNESAPDLNATVIQNITEVIQELDKPIINPKYIPIQNDLLGVTGILDISVRCHHNLFSKQMTIERVDEGNTIPFISGDRVSMEQFNAFKKEGGEVNIELRPDGTFSDGYVPATYAIKLLDGNGGQPEYSVVRVDGGYLSRVQFIGHAVSSVKTQEKPVDTCKDLVITTGNIHRIGLFYWFRIDVVNPNDMFTRSDVTITDSHGHILYDFPIFALTGDSYSFFMPTTRDHRDHNPLTVTVSGTRCIETHETEDS